MQQDERCSGRRSATQAAVFGAMAGQNAIALYCVRVENLGARPEHKLCCNAGTLLMAWWQPHWPGVSR